MVTWASSNTMPLRKWFRMGWSFKEKEWSSGETCRIHARVGSTLAISSNSSLMTFWSETLQSMSKVRRWNWCIHSSQSKRWTICGEMCSAGDLCAETDFYNVWSKGALIHLLVSWIGALALWTAGVKLWRSSNLGISKWSMGPNVLWCKPASTTTCLNAWNSVNESSMEVIHDSVNVGAWALYIKPIAAWKARTKSGSTGLAIVATIVCCMSWCSQPVICLTCETPFKKCCVPTYLCWLW